MRPPAPPGLLNRARQWNDLHQWERAELGRALRRLGWSYGEIREVIPVPKGTLSSWCRQVRLDADQVAALKARRQPIPQDTQRKRRLEIEAIRRRARQSAAELVNHLPHGICRVLMRRSTDAWLTTMEWVDCLRRVDLTKARGVIGTLHSGR